MVCDYDIELDYLFAIKAADKKVREQSGVEHRVRCKDGSWRWQTTNASPIIDEGGNIIVCSFLIDNIACSC